LGKNSGILQGSAIDTGIKPSPFVRQLQHAFVQQTDQTGLKLVGL